MSELLSRQFLESIGVSLDDETYRQLSTHYEHTLNKRVMAQIANVLDESQLDELSAIRTQDDDTIRSWLVVNVPDLDDIVEDEIAILLGDIVESADSL